LQNTRIVTAWTGGSWFDGSGFVRKDAYSVGGKLTFRRLNGISRTVDLSGGFVVPAFGEGHNHNLPSRNTEGTVRDYLSKGIFYVMIQENQPGARERLGPNVSIPGSLSVVFANGAFTAPGGHPSALVQRGVRNGNMSREDLDEGFLMPVSTPQDIDRQWLKVKQQHPDFVKVMLVYSEERSSGWNPPLGSDRFGLDPLLPKHIVELAHRDRLRVSAHLESAGDFEVAVATGADIVAHMPGFWPDTKRIEAKGAGIYRIKEEFARRAARRKMTVVTTISGALSYLTTDAEASRHKDAMMAVYRDNFAIFSKHGVRIVIGSDQNRGTSVHEALAIHEAKLMEPAALLRALSSDAASMILPDQGKFDLSEGARADFLVLESNPIEDIHAITKIRLRVKDGLELN
jgi:hypothetical protein